jgi:prepilin peptidase CpaA
MTLVLWVLVAVAAGFDLRHRRIPNPLVGVGLGLGIGAQFLVHGWSGLLLGLCGGGVVLAVLIAPFALRALGGGDVKMAMVVGFWTDPWTAAAVVLLTALLTGVIAAILWLILYFRPDTPPPRIPVAVPLAVATMAITAGLVPNVLAGS